MREVDLTLCPVIRQKQESNHAFRLNPPSIFLNNTGADEKLWMHAQRIGLHSPNPFEPLRLPIHTVLKENRIKPRALQRNTSVLTASGDKRGKREEKKQGILPVISLNCSTQKPLISGTHGALAKVSILSMLIVHRHCGSEVARVALDDIEQQMCMGVLKTPMHLLFFNEIHRRQPLLKY